MTAYRDGSRRTLDDVQFTRTMAMGFDGKYGQSRSCEGRREKRRRRSLRFIICFVARRSGTCFLVFWTVMIITDESLLHLVIVVCLHRLGSHMLFIVPAAKPALGGGDRKKPER